MEMSTDFLPNRALIDGLLDFVLFFFNSADKVHIAQITCEDQCSDKTITNGNKMEKNN